MSGAEGMAGASAQAAEPPGFEAILFSRSAPEDVERYDAAELALLAREAFRHLCEPRPEPVHSIRVYDPPAHPPERPATVTVLEVVNDDMPFLLDSTLALLGERGIEIRLVAHPIIAVERGPDGRFLALGTPGERHRESLIHIHLARLPDAAAREGLAEALDRVYRDVRVAVDDWPAMRARLAAEVAAYRASPPPLPAEEVSEATQFLEWFAAENFVFLGAREYRLSGIGSADLDQVAGTGLGILRDPAIRVLRRGRELVTITPEVMEFLQEPQALIITKANVRSRVHRRAHMDYVGVKIFADGALSGELRLVGLFTSSAYTHSTRSIPYVRQKVAHVLASAHLDPDSHSGKALTHVLETFPRDELFQIDLGTLSAFAREIAALDERPRLRVLARSDRFDRFVSVIAFVPRDRYDTAVQARIADELATVYAGSIAALYPVVLEGPLVRLHAIVARYEGDTPNVSREEVEGRVAAVVRTWSDALRDALLAHRGEAGSGLAARYGSAFPAGYRETFGAEVALADIDTIERLSETRPRAAVLYARPGEPPSRAGLKVFSRGRPIPLSERVPVLEHMGFRVISESTDEVRPGEPREAAWLHDMTLERRDGRAIDTAASGPAVEALLAAVFRGEAESDGYNALVLAAGLAWRDIALLRALSRFLQQARARYPQDYMAATLVANAPIAGALVELAYARFDPRPDIDAAGRAAREGEVRARIETGLASVASLDEDRILRRFLELLTAAVRTNFFQIGPDGLPREVIAFKFESRRIENLPLPRPLYEIAVSAPRVDGIHMRFGTVARGGLRWSDRPQDFRTEILALAKAQQVKNAVIVPVGAKGGFVPKRLPALSDREAWMAEGIAAYRTFVGALLDLTDNLDGAEVVPPENTVRHDGDDPYLVVAADKGTASFSDIANAISLEHRYWLGDAFASGGSAGYDHKRMGITARGAWEAVTRHFREMDVDIQHTPFTVAGVGDMSGDVFGNGMLLSPAIRLVAAFDHRDIFLDPDPDPRASLAERQRLFDLPRSSWRDYDPALLSAGGGVFSRQLKEIPLSPPAQAVLGLAQDRASPPEVISAILRAPVDLLWFGGIGTYVRGRDESDDAVGDRANDAVRVTGADLRCKVVGEGANLGMTQRGRIEAALAGVRLDTDAIDNSAGVNTSDVEVNIKIALATPLRDGRLDPDERLALLAGMTDEVAALVLRNNAAQTLALSLAQRRGPEDAGFAAQLMRDLEARGRLNRAVEVLPDDAALAERARAGGGLTRPELAVLLAYAKLALHDDLLPTPVPDDPYFAAEKARYFPRLLRERFPDAIAGHRLGREIVATALANAIVNAGGPTVAVRVAQATGADAAALARAFAAVEAVFGLEDLRRKIAALQPPVPGEVQLDLHARVQAFLLSRLVWFVRNVDLSADLAGIVGRFRAATAALTGRMSDQPSPASQDQTAEWERHGVPRELALRLAALDAIGMAPEVVLVAETGRSTVADVAAIFLAADGALGISRILSEAARLAPADPFEHMALGAAMKRIESGRRRVAGAIVEGSGEETGAAAVDRWIERGGASAERARKLLAEIAAGPLTLARVAVAANLVEELASGGRAV